MRALLIAALLTLTTACSLPPGDNTSDAGPADGGADLVCQHQGKGCLGGALPGCGPLGTVSVCATGPGWVRADCYDAAGNEVAPCVVFGAPRVICGGC